MSDNKSEPNYQDILDKYAEDIKTSTEPSLPQAEPELDSKQEPEPLLETELTSESKLEVHPQSEIETPLTSKTELKLEPEAELPTIPETEFPLESESDSLPEFQPQSEPLNLTSPPIPEAIIPSTPPPSLPKENKFFKYLFFLSLLIFLGVLSAIAYSFINTQKPFDTSSNTPTIAPTMSPELFCEINEQEYTVGQSFAATDGCNTCICNPDLTISCTEESCEATPSVSLTPTSTTSATKTPDNFTPTP